MRRAHFLFSFLVLPFISASLATAEEEGPTVVGENKLVSIEYTLKLEDGSVADTSDGKEPLKYQHGAGQILPALEEALAGMEVGQSRSVTLSPEKGYGVLNPSLVQEVPLEALPEEARKVGVTLVSEDPQGNRRLVRVQEVGEENAVVDLNHPLAGQTLNFDVKIVEIGE